MAGAFSKAINGIGTHGEGLFNSLKELTWGPLRDGIKAASEDGATKGGVLKAAFGGKEGDLTSFSIGKGENKTTLSGARIVGGAAGLALGYRALSGGGVYRNSDGQTDIAGLPFV